MKKLSKGFLKKLSLLAVAASACTVAGISTVANGEETTGLTAPLSENVKIGQVVEVPDYFLVPQERYPYLCLLTKHSQSFDS